MAGIYRTELYEMGTNYHNPQAKLYTTPIYEIVVPIGQDRGEITDIKFPPTAVAGSDVKVEFTVKITSPTEWWVVHDHYQFIIDADERKAIKGNYTSGSGAYTRREDITFKMPAKERLRFYIELWTEVPPAYVGVPIEGVW